MSSSKKYAVGLARRNLLPIPERDLDCLSISLSFVPYNNHIANAHILLNEGFLNVAGNVCFILLWHSKLSHAQCDGRF